MEEEKKRSKKWYFSGMHNSIRIYLVLSVWV
jgi:hypothetical protein